MCIRIFVTVECFRSNFLSRLLKGYTANTAISNIPGMVTLGHKYKITLPGLKMVKISEKLKTAKII